MTGGAALTFPGGRTLAGWWQQLAPHRPTALWVAHLLVHRVEALVRLSHACPLDRLERLLLDLLAAKPQTGLEELDDRLHLGRPLLRQVLFRLRRDGLLATDGRAWSLTPAGRLARDQGTFPRGIYARRQFHFVERSSDGVPPAFLAPQPYRGLPWPAGADCRFDPAWLADCLRRPGDWKRRHGFPEEVEAVVGPTDSAALPVAEWQTVVLDSPERLPVAVVLAPAAGGGERLSGFAFKPEGWVLGASEPVFSLGEGWREAFPELAADVPVERWLHAWRDWCQSRALSGPDVQPGQLERAAHRLRVSLARPVCERLRATQPHLFTGQVWLLAGEGRFRAAAQVEVAAALSDETATA